MEVSQRIIGTRKEGDFGIIEGYGTVWEERDLVGDVIKPYADVSIGNEFKIVPLMISHRQQFNVGNAYLTQDERGIYVKGRLDLRKLDGLAIYDAIKSGDYHSFSIGFTVFDKIDNIYGGEDIHTMDIFEVSIVNSPAQPKALIHMVKSLREDDNMKLKNKNYSPYLGSKQAVTDYFNVLEKTAQQNIGVATDLKKSVKQAWEDHLMTKGITNSQNMWLPDEVVYAFVSAINYSNHNIWRHVKKIKADQFRWFEEALAMTARGLIGVSEQIIDNSQKEESEFTILNNGIINTDPVYSYLQVSQRNLKSNPGLMEELVRNLTDALLRGIDNLILGISPDPVGSTFIGIMNAPGLLTSPYNPSDPNGSIMTARTLLTGEHECHMVCNIQTWIGFSLAKDLIGGENLTELEMFDLHIHKIHIRDDFPDNKILLFIPKYYALVSPDFITIDDREFQYIDGIDVRLFKDFLIQTNQNEFLQEVFAGGAPVLPNFAVLIQ